MHDGMLAQLTLLFFGSEATLRRTFGASYDAYCARTKRLIPGVI